MPAVASMAQDVAAQIPQNVGFVMVNQGEAKATLLHVMEKTYLPIKMVIDNCESDQYHPSVDVLTSRSFVSASL